VRSVGRKDITMNINITQVYSTYLQTPLLLIAIAVEVFSLIAVRKFSDATSVTTILCVNHVMCGMDGMVTTERSSTSCRGQNSQTLRHCVGIWID
jgi:hypothetical protein